MASVQDVRSAGTVRELKGGGRMIGAFLAGLFIGAFLGAFCLALCVVSRMDDDRRERDAQEGP